MMQKGLPKKACNQIESINMESDLFTPIHIDSHGKLIMEVPVQWILFVNS